MNIVCGILLALMKYDALTVSELHGLIPYAKPIHVRRILLRLQKDGLVEKYECKRGRCSYVYRLTETGRQKIENDAFKMRLLENMLFADIGVCGCNGIGRS
jgi:DNA-binding MarR family transcriptional regulator